MKLLGASIDLDAAREVWDGAVCAQVDPELFFPEAGRSSRPARNLCESCPVRNLCLPTFGPLMGNYGIVGGRTAGQRLTAERQHKGRAA